MCMQNNIEQPKASGLKKFWKKLIDIFFTKQFMLFVGIGIVNTVNGIWIPTVLSLIMNANVAFAIGYIPCLGISYLLNSKFTFHEKLSIKKLVKFCISYIPNYIIQNLSLFIFHNVLGLHDKLAIIIAAIIGVPVTFLLMKFYAFRSHKRQEKNA